MAAKNNQRVQFVTTGVICYLASSMCGRFTLTTDLKALAERFCVPASTANYSPRYNIAPTQPVIVVGDDGARYMKVMKWGLIPSWAKDPSIGSKMINARAETIAEKPSFRNALKKRRCLIPASGFYEWQKLGTGKQPLHIVLKSREPFAFAGVWEHWTSPEMEEVLTCTIITTAANELMKSVHDRMPVILSREDEAMWLDPKVHEPEKLLPLLKPLSQRVDGILPRVQGSELARDR